METHMKEANTRHQFVLAVAAEGGSDGSVPSARTAVGSQLNNQDGQT